MYVVVQVTVCRFVWVYIIGGQGGQMRNEVVNSIPVVVAPNRKCLVQKCILWLSCVRFKKFTQQFL